MYKRNFVPGSIFFKNQSDCPQSARGGAGARFIAGFEVSQAMCGARGRVWVVGQSFLNYSACLLKCI